MSIGRNASYNLIGALVPLALALITVPLYIRLIGAERYGVLAIAFLFLGYFGLFDLGLGRATSYRLSALASAERQDRATVFWTAVVVNLGMGLVGSAVLWAGATIFFGGYFEADPSLRQEILTAVPLLAACLPIATMTGVLTGALQARDKFLETNAISIASTSLFQLLPLAVAFVFGPNLSALLIAALVARGLAILLLMWRCHVEIARGTHVRIARSEASFLIGFGGWILVDGLLTPILSMVDRFAIGAVLGGRAVTLYTVPFQLAQRITIFPSALLNALFPRLPNATQEQRRAFADRATDILLAAITLPILVAIFFITPFFDLWLGPALGRPSAEVGVLILSGFWLNALAWVPYVWLQGTGRPDLVAKMHLLEVPPYLVALYFGLVHFGLNGVACVLIARNAADLILLVTAAGLTHTLKRIALFGGALIAATLIVRQFDSYDRWGWLLAVVVLAMTAILSWRLSPVEIRTRVLSLPRAIGRRA